jgi:hypothetical protein
LDDIKIGTETATTGGGLDVGIAEICPAAIVQPCAVHARSNGHSTTRWITTALKSSKQKPEPSVLLLELKVLLSPRSREADGHTAPPLTPRRIAC